MDLKNKYTTRLDHIREITHLEDKTHAYQSFIVEIENEIIQAWEVGLHDRCLHIESLMSLRQEALNNMFDICETDETAHFTRINEQIEAATRKMYERTRLFKEFLSSMPVEESDDDIEVEAYLRFWNDGEEGVLELETDSFYASNFKKMISILADFHKESRRHPEYIECIPNTVSIASREISIGLDISDIFDDGQSWAEDLMKECKRLADVNVCHAVHDICEHKYYSIPDLLRMKTFEMCVELKIQHLLEMDNCKADMK